ncbi:hypothetical protein KP509_02G038400 [Ceratopteris richardii]|uniref:Pollen Ole e 1 allergen and extensin family protein n=1 Tax=Ceratopteris richardii TaxID=49495 RepID=A0A8T2V8U2_CERRI|nr:hypothetical protein KP509_02G038400 [Ceratopteris richardii]
MALVKVGLLLAMACLAWATFVAGAGYYPQSDYGYGRPYYKRTLSVQGMVYCQNCLYVGTESLTDAKPIKGARVQLACRDKQYQTFLYTTTRTDENGVFDLTIPNFDFRVHDPMRTCRVFLLASYMPECKRTTSINLGHYYGGRLQREVVQSDTIIYSTGPFAFAPRKCREYTPYYHLSDEPAVTSYP